MEFTSKANCAFPQDLDAASYGVLQEFSDRANSALVDLQNIASPAELENLNSVLDAGLDIVNRMLELSGRTGTDLEQAIGIPSDNPSNLEIEKYLSNAGILVNGGLLLVPSASENLTPLRSLYAALGGDSTLTEKVLSEAITKTTAIFCVGEIDLVVVPKQAVNRALTIEELRDFTKINYLKEENVASLQDGSQLIVYRKFIDINKSLDSVARSSALPKSDLTTFVLHIGSVDNSVPAIERYQNLGYTSALELNAILTPSDYQDLPTDPVGVSLTYAKQAATSAINSINFLMSSFNSQTSSGLASFRANLSKELAVLQTAHQKVIAESYFYVSTLTDNTLYPRLLGLQDEVSLRNLMVDKPEITGIDLDATDQTKIQIMQTALVGTVGSSRVSNAYVNKQNTQEVYSKKSLTDMMSYIVDAINLNENKKVSNDSNNGQFFFSSSYLLKIKDLIVKYQQENPLIAPDANEGVVKTGYETFNSGSGALIQVMDINLSFNAQEKLDALVKAAKDLPNYFPKAVAQVMLAIVDFLKSLFSTAFAALKRLMDYLKGPLASLKNKLDGFMSKVNALLGGGDLKASILGCTLHLNLSLAFNPIDELYILLNNMQSRFSAYFSGILKFCSSLLEKVICYPSVLLGGLLPAALASLPAICSVDLDFTYQWPNSVMVALEALLSLTGAYSVTFNEFSSDLIKANIGLSVLPEKINQIKLAAFCSTPLLGSFANAANLNFLGASIGLENPLIGIQSSVFGPAGALKGFGL